MYISDLYEDELEISIKVIIILRYSICIFEKLDSIHGSQSNLETKVLKQISVAW